MKFLLRTKVRVGFDRLRKGREKGKGMPQLNLTF